MQGNDLASRQLEIELSYGLTDIRWVLRQGTPKALYGAASIL